MRGLLARVPALGVRRFVASALRMDGSAAPPPSSAPSSSILEDASCSLDASDPDLPSVMAACAHESTAAHLRRCWPLRDGSRRMIPALVPVEGNPLGFGTGQTRRPGTLLDYVCGEKEKHPDKVLLVRVGEFFEAFGIDALLLVEHCGLNGMGQKARAGCPRTNVQQTLDGLTGAGLTVAVYEEVEGFGGENTSTGKKRAAGGGLKQRYLSKSRR